MPTSPDELKELGNQAFAAKDYETAIKHYTSAIKANPKNHVFYSNRSASYGGKSQWNLAIEDAKECIKLEPTFIKGYYRLATAQLALEEWDAVAATIKQGLAVEPDNVQLQRQFQQMRQQRKILENRKKREANRKSNQLAGLAPINNNGMDPAAAKEIQELQQQFVATKREYLMVQQNLEYAQKELKSNEITKTELDKIEDAATPMYRSLGKIFVRSTRNDILEHLESSMQTQTTKQESYQQKLGYLQRRLQSQQQNLEELSKTGAQERS